MIPESALFTGETFFLRSSNGAGKETCISAQPSRAGSPGHLQRGSQPLPFQLRKLEGSDLYELSTPEYGLRCDKNTEYVCQLTLCKTEVLRVRVNDVPAVSLGKRKRSPVLSSDDLIPVYISLADAPHRYLRHHNNVIRFDQPPTTPNALYYNDHQWYCSPAAPQPDAPVHVAAAAADVAPSNVHVEAAAADVEAAAVDVAPAGLFRPAAPVIDENSDPKVINHLARKVVYRHPVLGFLYGFFADVKEEKYSLWICIPIRITKRSRVRHFSGLALKDILFINPDLAIRAGHLQEYQQLTDFPEFMYEVKGTPEGAPHPSRALGTPSNLEEKKVTTQDLLAIPRLKRGFLEVREASDKTMGRGLFTFRGFESGEAISLFDGHQFGDNISKSIKALGLGTHAIPVIRNLVFIDGMQIVHEGMACAQLANHSKHAHNAKFCYYTTTGTDRHCVIRATRDIKPGEEILVDYGSGYWRELHIEPVETRSLVSP